MKVTKNPELHLAKDAKKWFATDAQFHVCKGSLYVSNNLFYAFVCKLGDDVADGSTRLYSSKELEAWMLNPHAAWEHAVSKQWVFDVNTPIDELRPAAGTWEVEIEKLMPLAECCYDDDNLRMAMSGVFIRSNGWAATNGRIAVRANVAMPYSGEPFTISGHQLKSLHKLGYKKLEVIGTIPGSSMYERTVLRASMPNDLGWCYVFSVDERYPDIDAVWRPHMDYKDGELGSVGDISGHAPKFAYGILMQALIDADAALKAFNKSGCLDSYTGKPVKFKADETVLGMAYEHSDAVEVLNPVCHVRALNDVDKHFKPAFVAGTSYQAGKSYLKSYCKVAYLALIGKLLDNYWYASKDVNVVVHVDKRAMYLSVPDSRNGSYDIVIMQVLVENDDLS